ncbi:MAG: Hsp20 family protein, partial [Chloroflexi bacterium]|nr:Hsp20 family protein [Chloroflexota bacterium]
KIRLRPILMTSATMIFGMLPLALKLEPGAETRSPMAVVVIGALLSSTVLTLVVVPSLYTVMDDLQNKLFHRGAKGPPVTPTPHAAEAPATTTVPAHDVANGADHSKQEVPLNIADRGNAYVVRAALPGVKQEDVQVVVNGHTLTIRSREGGESTDDDWLVHEHSPAHWERTLNLPYEVDGSAISAEYQDGILELWLPKAEPQAERRIPVRSGGE